ncbi:MAG: outer membrane protein assembly factor BamA [Alphaproteobacteria bacterium]|nr:outer membrane protein assembly factor BamA [Alphaproteobacteria bacterium]
MNKTRLLLLASVSTIAACQSTIANASKITNILCNGCQRIDPETVKIYLPINIGDELDDSKLNAASKALHETGFFENVKLEIKGNSLVVTVKEYPIINRISYEGNSKLSDKDIGKATQLTARKALSPEQIKEAQQRLLEVYRTLGRYNATINPKIIKLPENRVDVVFEINEGDATGISKIIFSGNELISSSDLRDVIYSKIKRWYRFFASDDTYDKDRLEEDRIAIEKYYQENGFADARVISAVAELSNNKKEFCLKFAIQEGQQYKIENVCVKTQLKGIDTKEIERKLLCKGNSQFNKSLIEHDVSNISRIVGYKGFAAIRVKPHIEKTSKNTLNVTFEILEGERAYISKIIIKGNTKTRDHVIRREIPLEEGDAYNQALVTLAESNIRDLEFFKTVDIQPIQDPTYPDKYILQVTVEETSTAEASVAASYSTLDGIGVDLAYRENNFFGTGRSLDVFLGSSRAAVGKSRETRADGKTYEVSRKEKFRFLNNIQVSTTDRHLFDKDIEGSLGGYRYVSGIWDCIEVKELGVNFGISYALSSNFTQSWAYEGASRKFNYVMDSASPIIRYQTMKFKSNGTIPTYEDKHSLSSIKHTISFDKHLLVPIKCTFNIGLSTTFAGIGGEARHLKNELFGSCRFPVTRKTSLTVSLSTGLLSKIGNKQPHMIDSFQMGYEKFRGFEFSGLGPFSATLRQNAKGETISRRDYIGAKKYWKGTVEYTFPLGLPEELQFRGFVFSDFGTLWDAPEKGKKYITYTGGTIKDTKGDDFDKCTCKFDNTIKGHKILDRKKIRVSVGLGIAFVTPFGPIKLTYAKPIKKEKYDEQHRFLIGFSTLF